MDSKALNNISYGLYVLTTAENGKDNGCIINTAGQATAVQPERITFTVSKNNLTHDMVLRTGVFNLSILSTDVPFSVFEHFGFQSGRDVNKFADFANKERAANGIYYLSLYANSYLSGKVISTLDLGTHTLFVAELTNAVVLSNVESITYAYYHQHTKPKPQANGKKGFVCKVCGYVYEGDTLPADFVCPWCQHGPADFEPMR